MGPGMPSWQPAAYGIPVGTVCHWISQVGVVTTGVGGRGRQHFYQRNLHHNLWFQNSLFGIACNNYSSYGLHLNYVKLQLCVTINMINIGIHDLQVYSPFGTLQPKDRQLTPGWSHSTLKKGWCHQMGLELKTSQNEIVYIPLSWIDMTHGTYTYIIWFIYIYIYYIRSGCRQNSQKHSQNWFNRKIVQVLDSLDNWWEQHIISWCFRQHSLKKIIENCWTTSLPQF